MKAGHRRAGCHPSVLRTGAGGSRLLFCPQFMQPGRTGIRAAQATLEDAEVRSHQRRCRCPSLPSRQAGSVCGTLAPTRPCSEPNLPGPRRRRVKVARLPRRLSNSMPVVQCPGCGCISFSAALSSVSWVRGGQACCHGMVGIIERAAKGGLAPPGRPREDSRAAAGACRARYSTRCT